MIVWLTAFVAASVAELTIGQPLPELKGEFLSGKTAILPQASQGRVALLLLGFSYDSRIQVEDWAKRFRKDFEQDPLVTFYEIPMIGGIARLGKWFIDSGMRKGTPKADYEHVITVYGGTDVWKQRVGFDDPTAAYLILLDQNGRVRWVHSGPVGDQSYAELSARISGSLGAK